MPKVKEHVVEYIVDRKGKKTKRGIKLSSVSYLDNKTKKKLIFLLAGNVSWNGNLLQSRKARTF